MSTRIIDAIVAIIAALLIAGVRYLVRERRTARNLEVDDVAVGVAHSNYISISFPEDDDLPVFWFSIEQAKHVATMLSVLLPKIEEAAATNTVRNADEN